MSKNKHPYLVDQKGNLRLMEKHFKSDSVIDTYVIEEKTGKSWDDVRTVYKARDTQKVAEKWHELTGNKVICYYSYQIDVQKHKDEAKNKEILKKLEAFNRSLSTYMAKNKIGFDDGGGMMVGDHWYDRFWFIRPENREKVTAEIKKIIKEHEAEKLVRFNAKGRNCRVIFKMDARDKKHIKEEGGEVESDRIKLVVFKDHTLGYIMPELPRYVLVLHSSPLKGSPYTIQPSSIMIDPSDKIRLASPKDFEDFRISFEGFDNPEEYEFTEDFLEWTDSFKNWFKNSKVVDADGNPLIVYHGSPEEYDTFDLDKAGSASDSGMFGTGFYFSNNRYEAETYATRKGKKGRVKMFYLSLQNPLIIESPDDIPKIAVTDETIEDMLAAPERYAREFRRYLQDNEYDGVISTISDDVQYVALYPEQIKLADGSNTTFDPHNPDTTMEIGGEIASEALDSSLDVGGELGSDALDGTFDQGGESLHQPEQIIVGQSYLVDPDHAMYPKRAVEVVSIDPKQPALVEIKYYSEYEKKHKTDVIQKKFLYTLPAAVFDEGGEASIEARVEAYLKEREKGRKFKDTEGRVGGSAKEKRALSKILSFEEVMGIQDEATEREILKKDRLLDKIDAEKEKEAGSTSGGTYLKNELRKSIASKTLPEHKREARLVYAAYLNYLNQIMPSLKSYADIVLYISELMLNDHYFIEQIGLMVDPESYKAYMKDRATIDKKLKTFEKRGVEELKKPVLQWLYDNTSITEDTIGEHGFIIHSMSEDRIVPSGSDHIWNLEHKLKRLVKADEERFTMDKSEEATNAEFDKFLETYKNIQNSLYNEYKDTKQEYVGNIGKHLKETAKLINGTANRKVIPVGEEEEENKTYTYSVMSGWVEQMMRSVLGKKFYGFVDRNNSYHKNIDDKFDTAFIYEGLTKDRIPAYIAELKIKDNYEYTKDEQARYKKYLSITKPLDATGFWKVMNEGKITAGWSYSGGAFHGKRKVKRSNRGRDAKYWGWDEVAAWSDKNNSLELIEEFKKRIENTWYETYKSKSAKIDNLDKKYAEIKPIEEDWSWAIKKTKTGEKTIAEDKYGITINSGKPLARIKRKGGYLVKDKWIDDDEGVKKFLKEVIGIQRLEYGVSLPDAERKEHIRHFSQAIMDLHEILNWDMRTVIGWGIYHKTMDETYHGLALQLASAGRGKALAHYMPSRTSINLTRKKGDGSVCHEYGHYIDNYLSRIREVLENEVQYSNKGVETYLSQAFKIKRRKYYYPSIDTTYNAITGLDGSIVGAMKAIYRFIYLNQVNENRDDLVKLKSEIEPKTIEVEIKASDNKKAVYQSWEDVKDALAEGKTLEQLIYDWMENGTGRDLYENINDIKNSVGQILKDADQPKIMLNLKITDRETKYYSYSKRQGTYWQKPVELFARAFEVYIFNKLKDAGRENNYLVSGWYGYEVYPQGKEKEILSLLFDDLMQAIKVKFDVPDFSIPADYKMERGDEDIDLTEPEKPKKEPKKKKAPKAKKTYDIINMDDIPPTIAHQKLTKEELLEQMVDNKLGENPAFMVVESLKDGDYTANEDGSLNLAEGAIYNEIEWRSFKEGFDEAKKAKLETLKLIVNTTILIKDIAMKNKSNESEKLSKKQQEVYDRIKTAQESGETAIGYVKEWKTIQALEKKGYIKEMTREEFEASGLSGTYTAYHILK